METRIDTDYHLEEDYIGYIYVYGLYRENGKENGTHYLEEGLGFRNLRQGFRLMYSVH